MTAFETIVAVRPRSVNQAYCAAFCSLNTRRREGRGPRPQRATRHGQQPSAQLAEGQKVLIAWTYLQLKP